MLENMHIKNMVLIDEIDIDFTGGLNILTGETGAGKSVIIGSLGICLGGRFNKELLRDQSREGLVELTFSVKEPHVIRELEKLSLSPGEEGELVIRRILCTNGKTKNRINDITCTVATLKEAAALLLDLHAQHEQQTLLVPKKHLALLDEYGRETIDDLKQAVARAYADYKEAEKKQTEALMDETDRLKRMDYLEYQIKEIEAAKLVVGEDAELEAFYKKAEHAKEILEVLNTVYRLTGYGENASCGELLGRAAGELKAVERLDDGLTGFSDMLAQADALLNDFNRELSDYMSSMEFDEGALRSAEQRLDVINGLKLKYGQSIEEILSVLAEFIDEREHLLSYESYLEDLKRACEEKRRLLEKANASLTAARKKAAKGLTAVIREALLSLNFMQVEFDMEFEQLPDFSAEGVDRAVFMISTNVGEPMRPLHEIASGGELSRVMLAIKSCFAGRDDTPTLVFDEIDVGISGKTAQAVSERLSVIAGAHQVICITHLPQIAAMADSHFEIEKTVEDGKTVTKIRALDEEESVREIARLLTGAKLTESAVSHARELKRLAKK